MKPISENEIVEIRNLVKKFCHELIELSSEDGRLESRSTAKMMTAIELAAMAIIDAAFEEQDKDKVTEILARSLIQSRRKSEHH